VRTFVVPSFSQDVEKVGSAKARLSTPLEERSGKLRAVSHGQGGRK
jgi:hypothetical protein